MIKITRTLRQYDLQPYFSKKFNPLLRRQHIHNRPDGQPVVGTEWCLEVLPLIHHSRRPLPQTHVENWTKASRYILKLLPTVNDGWFMISAVAGTHRGKGCRPIHKPSNHHRLWGDKTTLHKQILDLSQKSNTTWKSTNWWSLPDASTTTNLWWNSSALKTRYLKQLRDVGKLGYSVTATNAGTPNPTSTIPLSLPHAPFRRHAVIHEPSIHLWFGAIDGLYFKIIIVSCVIQHSFILDSNIIAIFAFEIQ